MTALIKWAWMYYTFFSRLLFFRGGVGLENFAVDTLSTESEVLFKDTGGWSVNSCALFNEVSTKCSLANYHTLYIIK